MMNLISFTPLNKDSNNFNLMRLVFSSLVIFSHSYAFLGLPEPIIFGRTLGNFSVHAFFVVSGYLITASWLNSKNNIITYTENRILRIFPGLIVSIFICHYINIYFESFKNNPIPYIVNGPIWTLTWEITCYIAVIALGLLFVLDKKIFPAFVAACYLFYLTSYNNPTDFYWVIVPFMLFLCLDHLFL